MYNNEDELKHFNPFRDRNGRFASGGTGSRSVVPYGSSKTKYKKTYDNKKEYKNVKYKVVSDEQPYSNKNKSTSNTTKNSSENKKTKPTKSSDESKTNTVHEKPKQQSDVPKSKPVSDNNTAKNTPTNNNFKWNSEKTATAKRVVDDANNLIDQTRKLSRAVDAKKLADKKPLDLSQTTDKELRETIQRYNLEKQYRSIHDEQNAAQIAKGKQKLEQTLTVASSVLGATSTALDIALAIKKLK